MGSPLWVSQTRSAWFGSFLSMMPCTLTYKANDGLPSHARSGVNQRRRFSAFIRRGNDGRSIGDLPFSHGPNIFCDWIGHCGWIGRGCSSHCPGESDSRPCRTSAFSFESVAAKQRDWHRIGPISESAGTCDVGVRRDVERHGHGPLGCFILGSGRHSRISFGHEENVESGLVQRTSRRRGGVGSDGGWSANSSSAQTLCFGGTFLPSGILRLFRAVPRGGCS